MPFPKGESGNAGGRPSGIGWVRKLARGHTEEAVNTLVECLGDDHDGRVRVAAAQALLDRGYGKPTQPISGDEEGAPIAVAVSEELLALIAKLAG